MKSFWRVWIPVCALGAFCLGAMTGCNTMEGAGEDVQEAGEAVQDAAD